MLVGGARSAPAAWKHPRQHSRVREPRTRGVAWATRRGVAAPSVCAAAKKTVLVPIADGSEEIELVSAIDTFVRAGLEVTVAACSQELTVTASRGVQITADVLLADVDGAACFDAVVVPGGMPGAEHLAASEKLASILSSQRSSSRLVAAICAAPAVVLHPAGLLDARATSHPAFRGHIDGSGVEYSEDAVVVDGSVVTSRGPGSALEWALTIVGLLLGREKAMEVAEPMCLPREIMERLGSL